MIHHHSFRLVSFVMLIAVAFVLAVSPSSAASNGHAGTIGSGAQFDLYNVNLVAGTHVMATLVCAELSPGNRPLDPVLSVYFPGSDPNDTINADVYNDDGFGLDDDPNGVDCNAFDSSRVFFTAPVTGVYTLRADGFGSATGPYILSITDSPPGCDASLNIPSTAAMGAFVADAPVYSNPGVLIDPPITIPAGKTFWVLGLDATGQYYQIYLECSSVWVPASAVGPNFDDLWQGRPLPTEIKEASSK